MVSPSEGNEVTREACQEVRTPDSTDEVGELEPKRSRRREAGVESLDRCLELHQMPGNLDNVSTVQQRIASLVQRTPEFAFTSLAHFMTLEWLESAYHATRKDGAAGIDEMTGKQYADNLEENLRALHERLKSGTYKAPPVRRTHIPKGTSGETRRVIALVATIGIPTFEDSSRSRQFRSCQLSSRRDCEP